MRIRLVATGGLLSLCALFATFAGCSKEDLAAPPIPNTPQATPAVDDMRDLQLLAAQPDGGIGQLAANASTVKVPAGSVDALPAAIAAAGPHGVVLLRAGLHTQGSTVAITQPVSILGEAGAVLQLGCSADPGDFSVDPGLHVVGTSDVTVWGLELRPIDPIGGAAIVVQHAARTLIGRNTMTGFQNSIMLQHADRARIWGNTIEVTSAWLTGELIEADGIISANGDQVFVRGNDISGGFFGLFASDVGGQASQNRFRNCFIGMILCKVPPNSFQLPDGELIGSEYPATRWLVVENSATNNFDAGFLVIDGANGSWLVSNAGSGNGTYDIDLVGESMRFGFPTPPSHDNTVVAGRHPAVTIKNCGENNQVFGGVQVDTGADPCF